ncbi:outer membrane lipoprotein carrier protein LolA [Streptomyces sp. NPDC008150]|uniref:LolA family protein n=1 Tax=Streptomyces sp. NPDC008150 TaxID=3364816 RepID=UPI0036ED1294
MAPYESENSTTADETEDTRTGRGRAVRYVVPVAVVGVAAATIGLVPALAASGDPDLPKITARQLVEKIAASDVEQLSGTVKVSTDLGLPDLGGLESSLGADATGGGSSADPTSKLTELATGTHTLRVAADGPDRSKVSLLEDAAEYSLIHNGKNVWGYDSKSNTVYHSTVSGDAAAQRDEGAELTPKQLTDQALKAADGTTSLSVDGTERVAGRDAYKLVIRPASSGASTVGRIAVAVDAKTGAPLKFTLTPAGGGAAAVDAGFTKVSFAKPAASTFDFTPPKGAKVTEGDSAAGAAKGHAERSGGPLGGGLDELDGAKVVGTGWNSVATFDTGGKGVPSGSGGGEPGGFLASLGDRVSGDFGKGTVFSTRLVNALVTDDGKVYVGAVNKAALVKVADAAN